MENWQTNGVISDVHRPVLASMTFGTTPQESHDAVPITVAVASQSNPGLPTAFERGVLSAPTKLQVSLPHTIRRLARRLQDFVGSANSEQAAAELLSLVAVCASDEATRVQLLNVLCKPVSTHLMQHVVTRVAGEATRRVQLGDFVLGPFEVEKFLYAARRAGSDGWERLAADQRSKFAVVRRSEARTLPLCITPLNSQAEHGRLVEGLVASLYGHMADEAWANFWEALRDVQLVENAVRSAYLDVDSFRASALPGAHLWTIFSRIGDSPRGWVAPSISLSSVSLPEPAAFRELQRIIRDDLGFEGWKKTELSRTLNTFCRMLWRASSHEASRSMGAASRVEDAFLHHMIAIEILFSEKSSPTASVTRRTAAVIHSALNHTYAEARTEVESLYELRSRYVHQGVTVGEEHLGSARRITAALSEWLLLLASRSDATWTTLVKQVDLLAATLEAEQAPQPALTASLSIQSSSAIPTALLSQRA